MVKTFNQNSLKFQEGVKSKCRSKFCISDLSSTENAATEPNCAQTFHRHGEYRQSHAPPAHQLSTMAELAQGAQRPNKISTHRNTIFYTRSKEIAGPRPDTGRNKYCNSVTQQLRSALSSCWSRCTSMFPILIFHHAAGPKNITESSQHSDCKNYIVVPAFIRFVLNLQPKIAIFFCQPIKITHLITQGLEKSCCVPPAYYSATGNKDSDFISRTQLMIYVKDALGRKESSSLLPQFYGLCREKKNKGLYLSK